MGKKEEAIEFLAYGVGSIFAVGAVIVALWGFGWLWNQSIGSMLNTWNMGIQSQIQKSNQAAKDYDPLKDPTSIESMFKKCEDKGGWPTYHAWKDDVECDFSGKHKS